MAGFFQDVKDYIVQMFNVYAFLKKNVDLNDEESRTYIFKSFIFSISIFISAIVIFYASTDSNSLTNRTFTYAFLIILPLILGIIYSANIKDLSDESYVKKFLIGAILLFVVSIVFYFLSMSSTNIFVTINNVIVIIIVLILLIGLALFYNVFSSYLKNQRGIIGFIINLLFYIPCLLNDFLIYLKAQVGITSSIVLVLFVLEILFILMYFYIPVLIDFLEKKNSIVLLEEPTYLNKQKTIANHEIFILKDTVKMDKEVIGESIPSIYKNSNYAFSFWVYLNPDYINTEYTSNPENGYRNIFNYAGGKPSVAFLNNQFIINFTNNTDITKENTGDYQLMIPIQKWTNFTFNYFNNSVDLFVNGDLEITFSFNDNNIPLDGKSTDTVSIGDNNGLNGSICNVKYYTNSLTSSQIKNNYYILAPFNPPILQ